MPIKPSKDYALAKDNVVIEKASKGKMVKQMRKNGGHKARYSVWLSPNSKVGDKLK